MAPVEDLVAGAPVGPGASPKDVDEWANNVDEVTEQIRGIIDGTITDFDAFDRQLELKDRAKQIREEEAKARKERFFLNGTEGKGEGQRYKWWCKRCFVEYHIDLPEGKCTRCGKDDMMMSQQARRDELMGKLEVFKEEKAKHQWRKDKWNRWKKSQALLGRSRNINYKAWEYWEPETDTEDEGEPIVPRDNPEFLAMEADLKQRKHKQSEKAKTAEKCRQRGNQCMKEGDFIGAIENYEEGLEYNRSCKALWTNKALAELKVFRYHDAINSCNKVVEYAEIFEDGFKKNPDACFKAFVRRATALRALHKWDEAVNDIEDALKLFPRDKDARDLLEKTKAACEEARLAQDLQEGKAETSPDSKSKDAQNEGSDAAPAPTGPVRVEIEESDEEEDEDIAKLGSGSQPGSLAGLSKQEYSELLKSLKGSEAQRVMFCARKSGDSLGEQKKEDQWVGRKVVMKVEEVAEPSRLDSVLRDCDRCHVLWKKRRPDAAGRITMQDDEPEAKEADAYISLVTPRVLGVLYVLATSSDHHCALTAPAIRNVWPLMVEKAWRYDVLQLLCEWSQRSISAKALADFAGRYADPHVRLLIEAASEESKESILPPGFEDRAKKAADRFELGQSGMEDAMEEVMKGLMVQSPVELALSTIGNCCLAGAANTQFKEQMAAMSTELVGGICKHLRPLDWRVCGKAAGALCNVVRLGEACAAQVQDKCVKPLMAALREECKDDSPAATMKQLMEQAGGAGGLPVQAASSRILGALVNLVVVRPAALQDLHREGCLELVVPLIDPELKVCHDGATASALADDEASPEAASMRAALLTSRLVGSAPSSVTRQLEAQLLTKVQVMLENTKFAELKADIRAFGSGSIDRLPVLEWLDPAVRMIITVLMKTPGAMDRLTESAPRIEELPDDLDSLPARQEPAVSCADLVGRLSDLVKALRPSEHVAPLLEGSTPSRLRGNLALLFGALSEAQAREDASSALRNLDLSPLVEVFIDSLRKERGAVQTNLGVCVTKLAQNPRYRQQVRDLKGIESLHQIQLPKVQAQKAQEEKMHRLDTSAEDRKREILRRLEQQRALKGLD